MRNRRGFKLCPWCGSHASLIKDKLWQEHSYNGQTITHGYVGNYEYYIRCDNDDCWAVAPNGRIDDIYRSSEEAIRMAKEAWQRRANNEIDTWAFTPEELTPARKWQDVYE